MSWQGAVETTVTGLGYELVDAEKGAGGLLPGRNFPSRLSRYVLGAVQSIRRYRLGTFRRAAGVEVN